MLSSMAAPASILYWQDVFPLLRLRQNGIAGYYLNSIRAVNGCGILPQMQRGLKDYRSGCMGLSGTEVGCDFYQVNSG
jgi:hypothetical protein